MLRRASLVALVVAGTLLVVATRMLTFACRELLTITSRILHHGWRF
jgi:hypothetical protein